MTDDFTVVGTDTGVGKTVVTAGLVGMLRADGIDAQAIKPCQTGYPPDDDAGFVAEACGTDAAATCLRRLEPPLAPEIAADREGVRLSYADLLSDCEQALAEVERGIVEGIGGLHVPLTERKSVIDLVADLDLPTVIVARSGLGTLNHTALTVEALRRRKIAVLGIVLNEYEGTTVAERTNPAMLGRMTNLPVQTFPPVNLSNPAAVVREMREHFPRSLLENTG